MSEPDLTPTAKLQTANELRNANEQLEKRVGLLTKAIEGRHSERANSLLGLADRASRQAQAGQFQDPIASINPLYRSAQYFPLSIDFPLLGYLYQTHGALQTMIDEPVLDAFRGDDGPGFELTSREMGEGSVGSSGLGELEDFAEEIDAWETLKYTLMWGGLYGGSGLVINAGQDPEKPLDVNDIKRGRLEFYDADRWEFSGAYRSADKFEFYGKTLDASRVITYGGKRAPRLLRVTLGGWGMSEMQRAVEDFNVWLRGRNSLYSSIDKANIDVYGIEGYADTIMTPAGEQTMLARMAATNSLLNFAKALVIDSKDEYKVVTRSLGYIPDTMREIRIGLSCATRMPYIKLWGTGAGAGGGVGADGAEMEMENYNALVMSRVRVPARRMVRKMLRLMMIAVFGKEYDVAFKFHPLRVLTAQQEEEVKKSKQTRYIDLYDRKLLTSKEVGDLLHKDKLVPIETKAQQGLLPDFPEVPTVEQMFKSEEGGEDGENGKGGGAGRGAGDGKRGGDGGAPEGRSGGGRAEAEEPGEDE